MTDLTNAEIVAACMSAVSDRDPRIVAALDLIESIGAVIDNAATDSLRLELAFGALDSVQFILSQPPLTVSQPATDQASPA
jgi:hypothetical protein